MISDSTIRIADRQFIAQLATATRGQLYAMRKVFVRLGSAVAWKRAAVETRIARLEGERAPASFGWMARDEWWGRP